MCSPVIIALDFPGKKEVETFLEPFYSRPVWVKVGMELFYEEGSPLITALKEKELRIFLDLKLHDIPTTVEKAMTRIAKLGVDMVNVHAAGGTEMMKAAIRGLEAGSMNGKRPICIAVTQLTSTSQEVLQNELLISETMEHTVGHYAKMAKESGLDGVVCSPLEVPHIKRECGSEFLAITPGIRLSGDEKNDQKRVADPAAAKELGSDYIVVGRSITKAYEPLKTYLNIEKEWGIHYETSNR